MAKQQPIRRSVPELVSSLSDSDRHRRFDAVRELVNTGLAAASAWPQVRALLADPYFAVRLEVVRGTYLLGVAVEEALPLLRRFLRDEDSIVRSYAKWALEQKYGQSGEGETNAEQGAAADRPREGR